MRWEKSQSAIHLKEKCDRLVRIVTVKPLTGREESTKCFAGSAQVCEWAEACVVDCVWEW